MQWASIFKCRVYVFLVHETTDLISGRPWSKNQVCPIVKPISLSKNFNWRVIALHGVSFCCTAMWISYKCAYFPSLLSLLPITSISRSSQSTQLSSLFYITASHKLSNFTHGSVYVYMWHLCQCCSLNSSHPLLPPLCPQSVFSVCVSIPDLQIGSSVLFFWISYIYVNMWYLFFFFWFIALCITGSRIIHLTIINSNSFFFMTE